MADCTLFREDEVFRVNQESGEKTWGLILENSAHLDSSDDEDDDEEFERLKPGEVRVAWFPDGEEEVLQENTVTLDDRSLMPSDVVRRGITGTNLQRGFVRRVHVHAEVQVCDTSITLPLIKAEDLMPMQKFEVDTDVALGSWLGQVRRVEEELTLRFPDGAKVVMKDEDAQELDQVSKARQQREGTEYDTAPWYRGQKLSGNMSHFQDVEWVKTTNRFHPDATKSGKRSKKVKVTIEEVKLASMEVHWICRGFSQGDDPHSKSEAPSRHIKANDIKDLRKLNCFEHCSIQLGDPNLYVLTASDLKHIKEQRERHDSARSASEKLTNGVGGEDKDARDFDSMNGGANSMNGDDSGISSGASDNKANDCDSENTGAGDFTGTERGAGAIIQNGIDRMDDDDDFEDDEDDDDLDEDDGDVGEEINADKVHLVELNTSTKGSRSGGLLRKARRLKIKTPPPPQVKSAKKTKTTKKDAASRSWTVGTELCVEVVRTLSFVDVIWQDGSIENYIPSTELYPIHHVDEQDYFPGDYCVKGDSTSTFDTYGVVQQSDNKERTCRVLWFRPYIPGKGAQKPTQLEVTDCSVYDIKDHPDFGCGPGTVVIRISGFEEDNDACVGQIVDSQTDGQLSVTWCNGKTSNCYAQDLFICGGGELNSIFGEDTEDELLAILEDDWDDSESNQSWETESEDSEWESDDAGEDQDEDGANGEIFDSLRDILDDQDMSDREKADIAKAIKESLKDLKGAQGNNSKKETKKEESPRSTGDDGFAMMPTTRKKLLDTLAKGQTALKRLDEIFAARNASNLRQLPGVEISFVFKEILHLFHCCRDMDRLMETRFFNESLFDGHLADIRKRVRKEKQDKIASRVLNRLEAHLKAGTNESSGSGASESGGGGAGENGADGESEGGAVAAKESFVENFNDNAVKRESESEVESKDSRKDHLTESQGAEASQKKDDDDDDNPEYSEIWQLCSTVCGLLTENMTEAMTEIKKRVDQLKIDVDGEKSTENRSQEGNEENEQNVEMKDERVADENGIATPDDVLLSPSANSLESAEGASASSSATFITPSEAFLVLPAAPENHKFYSKPVVPTDQRAFASAIRKELKLMASSLPEGIFVRSYDDRMDLFNFMIKGPAKTPYEDGIFLFDAQLPADYPKVPPVFHYVSYCSDRLNPNLYENGKVCVSLLGTWDGKGTEVWNSRSSLLQVLISIQGLILVSEPYYNEAGYERQKGSRIGAENARMYNEMAVLKLTQHMGKLAQELLQRAKDRREQTQDYPNYVWGKEVSQHFKACGPKLVQRLEKYLLDEEGDAVPDALVNGAQEKELSEAKTTTTKTTTNHDDVDEQPNKPLEDFPLLPVSKGFKLTLKLSLKALDESVKEIMVLKE